METWRRKKQRELKKEKIERPRRMKKGSVMNKVELEEEKKGAAEEEREKKEKRNSRKMKEKKR